MDKRAKRLLKYYYYRTLCILLGQNSPKTSSRLQNLITRYVPGKSAALLRVYGAISGMGYSKWLRQFAQARNVSCYIKRRGNKRVEILLVGQINNIAGVAQAARMGPGGVKIRNVDEKWLNKRETVGQDSNRFVLVFGGDTSLGDYYLRKPGLEKEYLRLKEDPLSYFEGILPLISNNNHLTLNLETVLAEEPVSPLEGMKKWMGWDNPDRTSQVLKALGVDAVSLANNHTMDFGPDILFRTRKLLKEAGIQPFGAGASLKEASKPIKIKCKSNNISKNIYIFAAMRVKWAKRFREDYRYHATSTSPGVNIFGTKRICRNIARLREKDPNSLIIIFPHWQGYDYEWAPENIKTVCKEFLDHGADYVFGHGSHNVQQIEKYESGVVAHSIGNLVFNSKGRYKKKGASPFSTIVRLELRNEDNQWNFAVKFYPIVSNNLLQGFRPRPVNEKEFYRVVTLLKNRSAHAGKFLEDFKLCRDQYGWHLSIGDLHDKESTVHTLPPPRTELEEIIMDENNDISDINFNDLRIMDNYINQLEQLHNKIDTRLSVYYRKLLSSKLFRGNNQDGEPYYAKLGEILKKEYVTHNFLRKLERRKLKIEKAISFRDITVERSAMRLIGCPEYAWMLDKKNVAYKLADSIGLRRPKNNLKSYKLSEIEEQNGPVVIKPVHCTGSIGVYLVFNKNIILSARKGIYLSGWSHLMDDASRKLEAGRMGKSPLLKSLSKDEWMIEELITGPEGPNSPASDLKFYTFYGEVLLISESNPAHHKKFCFWDPDMQPVKTGRYDDKTFVGSGFTKNDLDTVISSSLQIPAPFLRLDMLKGNEGLVLCEITPRPGNFQLFNPEYDKKMGEAYRRAESRILRDLLNGKKFDAFTSIFEV